MFKDNLKVSGNLAIKLYDETGAIKEEKTIPNLVVTTGKNWIASRMNSATQSVMSHMSVGTGTTNPAAGDTKLENEIAKVALTSAIASSNTITYTANFGAGTGTGALTEAGIFNASGANTGTMLCRTEFGVVTKGELDTLAISWIVYIT